MMNRASRLQRPSRELTFLEDYHGSLTFKRQMNVEGTDNLS